MGQASLGIISYRSVLVLPPSTYAPDVFAKDHVVDGFYETHGREEEKDDLPHIFQTLQQQDDRTTHDSGSPVRVV